MSKPSLLLPFQSLSFHTRAFSTASMAASPLESNISDFYSRIESQSQVSLSEISQFIGENFVQSGMSFDQYEELYPVVDEMVLLATKQAGQDGFVDGASVQDAESLLAFGMIYSIEDVAYWRLVQKVTEQVLESLNPAEDVNKIIQLIS